MLLDRECLCHIGYILCVHTVRPLALNKWEGAIESR